MRLNGKPVFSYLTGICTDVGTLATSSFSILGYEAELSDPTASVTVQNGPCFTGLSGAVANTQSGGLYVSTITTNQSPPQALGYSANNPPYNVPERPLGVVQCTAGEFIVGVSGRNGAILESCALCAVILSSFRASPPPPGLPPATPNGVPVCFTGSGGASGSPFPQQGCPSGSCVSTITTGSVGILNNEPVFSSLTGTCTNVGTGATTTFSVAGYAASSLDPMTSITVEHGPCCTGLSGAVAVTLFSGLYVSTITTNESPPQMLGYKANDPPLYVPERPLGVIQCAEGSFLVAVSGRAGAILDELCFVCGDPSHPLA